MTHLIDKSPEILSGTPVFHGTRVPIHTLIDYISDGETIDAFLDDFPTVSAAQVSEFLASAEQLLIATSDMTNADDYST